METNEIINDIYQNTLNKFYEAMKNINIEPTENSIDYIKNQLNDILDLLKKCLNGVIKVDSIKLLSDIYFKDFLRDKRIIEVVNCNQVSINNCNVYVKKTSNFLEDDYSFYRIIEKNGQYIAIKYYKDNVIKENISLNDLSSFVSLAKVLNDSKYIGYSAHQWLNGITILYSGKIHSSEKYFTLYRKADNSIESCVTFRPYATNGYFEQIYYTEKCNLHVKSKFDERCINNDDGQADRAFIIKVVEEQLNKQYNILEEETGTIKPNVLSLTQKNKF